MKILNSEKEDYHIHSLNYSDGLNTIDEIVVFAGKIGMKKIAITDHSLATLKDGHLAKKGYRAIVNRWKNVHNKVEVIFGIEADLLNAKGDVCMTLCEENEKVLEETFVILSYHDDNFQDKREDVVKGFINAIKRYHSKINFIGHVCNGLTREEVLLVIKEANKYNIPLELNSKYYIKYPEQWDVLFENADQIYINSDAHILSDIRDLTKDARALMKKRGFLK